MKSTILTPASLSGFVAPWNQSLDGGRVSYHKLITYNGLEYFIDADSEWRDVLSLYCWEEVKVIGFLNVLNMTLIPEKVYPKGPAGEKESAIDLVDWKSPRAIRKSFKKLNDLVVAPAAARTLMSL